MGDNDEFYHNAENAKSAKHQPKFHKTKKFSSRPITGRSQGPEEFFTNFSKYVGFTEMNQTYEELFDRNERTLSATFAKFGDLGFYSPIQRVGSYMQYSAKLKIDHLHEVINLQKTSSYIMIDYIDLFHIVTNVEKPKFEIPIQLAIVDEGNPFQSKMKYIICGQHF